MKPKIYTSITNSLFQKYGSRLKTVVLFGSQARDEARSDSDHDIFVVIEDLPAEPVARQRDVRSVLINILDDLPGSITFVAKTPSEVNKHLTPLMLDICIDGIALYGKLYFQKYHRKALAVLKQAGLNRKLLAGTWMWVFPHFPASNWELNWEGFHEFPG